MKTTRRKRETQAMRNDRRRKQGIVLSSMGFTFKGTYQNRCRWDAPDGHTGTCSTYNRAVVQAFQYLSEWALLMVTP